MENIQDQWYLVRYFLNWDFLFEFCYWNHYLNSMTINQQIDDSFVVSNFLTATCDFWTIHFWWSYFSLNRFLLCSLRTKLKCGLYYYVLFKWKFDFILYWNLSGTVDYWVPEIWSEIPKLPVLQSFELKYIQKAPVELWNRWTTFQYAVEILLLAWYSMNHKYCPSFLICEFYEQDWIFW